jgi:predicted dehydrogenase
MTKEINIGILGFGGAGIAHARRFSSLEGVNISLVYDPKLTMIKERADKYSEFAFTDKVEEILKSSIDAVSICTPEHTHFQYARMAVEHGLHVLVEKPMFVNRDECSQFEKIMKGSDLVFGVHHQMRYIPAFRAARDLVQSGQLGEILMIEADYIHDMRERATRFDDWRFDEKDPQNIVLSGMSHTLDMIRWILDEDPCKVVAFSGHRGWPEYPDIDTVSVMLKFSSGVLGKTTKTIASRGPQRNTLAIYGTNGQIHNNIFRNDIGKIVITTDAKMGGCFDNISLRKNNGSSEKKELNFSQILTNQFKNRPRSLIQVPGWLKALALRGLKTPITPLTRQLIKSPRFRDYPFSVYEHDYACQALINDFVAAVRGLKKFPVDFSEGRAAVELCLSCIESYEAQKVIQKEYKN